MRRNPYVFSGNLADAIVDNFKFSLGDYIMELNDKRKGEERRLGDPQSFVIPHQEDYQIASNWIIGRYDSSKLVDIVRDKARAIKKDQEMFGLGDKEYGTLLETVIEATDEQIVQALDAAKPKIEKLVRVYDRIMKKFFDEYKPR